MPLVSSPGSLTLAGVSRLALPASAEALSLNNHTTLLRFNLCSAFLFLRVFFGPALRVYMYQSFFFSDGSS